MRKKVLIALVFNFKGAFRGIQRYVTILLFLMVSGYVLAYMISSVEISFLVAKTWSRFLIHILPIAVYWLALSLKEDPAPS